MIGTELGRYRILEPLGEGGMGRVFLAEDPMLGRRLAVKVLPDEFIHDPERRARLLHEARAASALNHPNIVVVHDVGETDGRLWIAMERVDGVTLRDWAAPARAPAETLRVLRQAAAALAVAHDAGLVHRDLKPDNLMVRPDGLLKILDFGLARSVSPAPGERTATMPGAILGTAPYMSPEQVLGQPAGPASDLFSLGTILYELLTGRHPFQAASSVETMHQILHETPERPSTVNPALTTDFDFVLAKVLSKDPARRHASARDLDNDLDTLQCGCLATVPTAAAAEGDGPRAIAVLPFKNIGGDKELAYLGIGLADAVITRLSTSPDLVVRATSSISRFVNQAVDPRHIGRELGVHAVLDASYQRAGGRFRATARLVETPSGKSLWAGKVDVRFDDIFDVQDQVANGIAEAMTARLGDEAPSGPARPYTPSAEVFQLYMRATEMVNHVSAEHFRRGIEYLERALAVAPEYARAWGLLAAFYSGMVDGGFESDPAWYERADQAVARAVSLDPADPYINYAAGINRLVRGRKAEAWEAFRRTAAGAPHYALLYHYLSYLFRLCSMLDEAVAASRHAMALDPGMPWPALAVVRIWLLMGEDGEALAATERAEARFGSSARAQGLEAAAAIWRGDHGRVLAMAREADPRGWGEITGRFAYSLALLLAGRREEASPLVAAGDPFGRIDMDSAAVQAALYAHLGDRDRAFAFLERAYELGNDCLPLFRHPVFYAPLHGDPRWEPFLDRAERRVAEWKRLFRWPLPAA